MYTSEDSIAITIKGHDYCYRSRQHPDGRKSPNFQHPLPSYTYTLFHNVPAPPLHASVGGYISLFQLLFFLDRTVKTPAGG